MCVCMCARAGVHAYAGYDVHRGSGMKLAIMDYVDAGEADGTVRKLKAGLYI